VNGALRTGDVIDGKFRLRDVVREVRGMVVFRADHLGIGRPVELKTLAPSSAESSEVERLLTDRLDREARVLGAVAHRNVQSVVDSGRDAQGGPYVVYEALAGRSLDVIMRESPEGLPVDRGTRLMVQILEGLFAVHSAGVVHNALDPSAVVVVPLRGGTELAKLTSFDRAVLVDDDVEAREPALARSVAPPSPYIAPEARATSPSAGRIAPDPRIDVYAAGVLLREMLTGRTATHGSMSDAALRLVERATAQHPDDRFQNAGQMLGAVRPLVSLSNRPPALLPDDALEADLHYLAMRRRAGHGQQVASGSATRVELLPVLLFVEAIFRKLGQASWDRLAETVPEVEQILPGAPEVAELKKTGVAAELVGRILRAADELGGRGDLVAMVDLGEAVARRGIRRIAPALPQPLGIDALIAALPALWPRIVRGGELGLVLRERHHAELEVRGQAEPHLEVCAMVATLIRGTARTCDDGTRARMRKTSCAALGDAACRYSLVW